MRLTQVYAARGLRRQLRGKARVWAGGIQRLARRLLERAFTKTAAGLFSSDEQAGRGPKPPLPELLIASAPAHPMHARQQAEIAAWLAVHSPALLQANRNHDALRAQHYWTNSKVRINRWNAALKVFADDFADPSPQHNPWPAFEIIAEEIFLSEMLTRIWATFLVSIDFRQQREEYTGLAYSTYIAHVETKNRVFRLLLSAQGKNETVCERLNQLRRLVEKWTDLFLAWFPCQEVAQRFVYERKRLADFAQERGFYDDVQSARQQQVLISSMLRGFQQSPGKWSANPELNRRIVDGVVACLENEAFDRTDIPGSLRQVWAEKAHSDTQLLVEQLNLLDGRAASPPGPHFTKMVN